MQQQECGSGFLITCDKNKEKLAIKDAYNFLNQYIQQIYGDIQTLLIKNQLQAQGKKHDLANELHAHQTLKPKLKLLTSIDTKVNCLIFIKINKNLSQVQINPYKIVNILMKQIHKQHKQITRYCHKIIPIQKYFKAQHFKMLDQLQYMVDNRDNSCIKSWSLLYKCRYNSKFNFKQVLNNVENILKKFGHFVDIYYPQWVISIQIVNHLMCLSILENYQQFDQYRLHKKGKIQQYQQQNNKFCKIQEKKQEKKKNVCENHHKKIEEREIQKTQKKEIKQQQSQNNEKEQKIKVKQQQQINKQRSQLLQQKIQINNDEEVQFI